MADLGPRFGLPSEAIAKFGSLVELVASDPHAPTAIRDRDGIIDDHLADSLVALDLVAVRSAREAVDLGSGAGFPGLALAIALPQVDFVLVESSRRKCAFLERAVAECGIVNAEVVPARAESFTQGAERFDLATVRALASPEVTAEYAAPLLRVGGTLVAWRGRRETAAEATLARAAPELGLGAAEVVHVEPYPAAQNRHLYVVPKTAETPSRFPRRPGMAAKHPLGRPSARSSPSDRVQR